MCDYGKEIDLGLKLIEEKRKNVFTEYLKENNIHCDFAYSYSSNTNTFVIYTRMPEYWIKNIEKLNQSLSECERRSVNISFVRVDGGFFLDDRKTFAINNIEAREVCTANEIDLFVGVTFFILAIIIEITVVSKVFIYPIKEILPCVIIYRLLALDILWISVCEIKNWFHRIKFTIYHCKINNELDIDYIKENFLICEIDENNIEFTNKENKNNYSIFKWGWN